ncbi:MAG: TIGR03086 family metal-binding protein [Acidimicrobiia bacterium]
MDWAQYPDDRIVVLHRRAVAGFDERVRAIGDGQWANPTPCTEWDVRDLVNHLTFENRWTPRLLAGETIAAVGDRYDGDLLGDDPVAMWRDAATVALAAVAAADLSTEVHVSWGVIPAREYVTQLTADHLIHGWDLGRGIGGDETLVDDLTAFVTAYIEPRREFMAASGVFAAPLDPPPGSSAAVTLLACYGRRAWA